MLKPCMTDEEIKHIDDIMNERKPKTVLEWGIGGSTARWSQLDFVEQWTGIEHNQEWVDKVYNNVDNKEKVKLFYCPTSTDTYKYASQESIKCYIDSCVNSKFDCIIIDGDYRIQCFKKAKDCLNENGFVLVHDTARKYMHSYFNLFTNHKILTVGEFNSNNDWHQGLTILWN